jgi:hypothetical protein
VPPCRKIKKAAETLPHKNLGIFPGIIIAASRAASTGQKVRSNGNRPRIAVLQTAKILRAKITRSRRAWLSHTEQKQYRREVAATQIAEAGYGSNKNLTITVT